jgi:hypothetical protein
MEPTIQEGKGGISQHSQQQKVEKGSMQVQ